MPIVVARGLRAVPPQHAGRGFIPREGGRAQRCEPRQHGVVPQHQRQRGESRQPCLLITKKLKHNLFFSNKLSEERKPMNQRCRFQTKNQPFDLLPRCVHAGWLANPVVSSCWSAPCGGIGTALQQQEEIVLTKASTHRLAQKPLGIGLKGNQVGRVYVSARIMM